MKLKLTVLVAYLAVSSTAFASGLTPIDDEQLAEVKGQDGVYLNIKDFSFTSDPKYGFAPLTLTYTMPFGGDSTHPADPFFKDPTLPVSYIQYGNISISRKEGEAEVFTDPYQIQIETLAVPSRVRLASEVNGTPDPTLALPETLQVVRLLNPQNLAGTQIWQMRHDWKVATGVSSADPVGNVHEMGSYVLQDLRIYGGGLDLAPAWSYKNKLDVTGTAFGLDLNMTIGRLMLLPRSDAVANVDDPLPIGGMEFKGVQIGRAKADMSGVDPDKTKAWRVADVIQQPGIINAITGEDGKSVFHMGIQWYRGGNADVRPESVGAFSVDQVNIRNGAGDVKQLGSMSVGGIQIKYLDVTFRNPN